MTGNNWIEFFPKEQSFLDIAIIASLYQKRILCVYSEGEDLVRCVIVKRSQFDLCIRMARKRFFFIPLQEPGETV